MQKKCVCSFLFHRVWFGLILFLKEKKKISSCVSGPRKKNLFGDEMHAKKRLNKPRFPHFLHNIVFYDGSLFFDSSGSAREQSRFCKQGTINE
jgi:hypothetical protein